MQLKKVKLKIFTSINKDTMNCYVNSLKGRRMQLKPISKLHFLIANERTKME